jgi:hypothetical protein
MSMDAPIVFVEVGRKIPSFAKNNIQFLRTTFPQLKIILITDQCYSFDGVQVCNTKELENDDLVRHFKSMEKDWGVRLQQDYWRLTTERFFWINAFMMLKGYDSIIHLESDVLLLNPLALNKMIDRNFGLSYSLQNANHGCAGVFVVSKQESLLAFLHFVLNNWLRFQINDQILLAEWISYGNRNVQVFDPIPKHLKFDKVSGQGEKISLVDPGDFGIYLFGNDARNNRLPFSRLGVILNPDEFEAFRKYIVKSDILSCKNKISLYFSSEEYIYEIVAIHLHGKRIPKSPKSLKRQLRLRIYLLNSKLHRTNQVSFYSIVLFDFRVTLERAISYLYQRKLLNNRWKDFRIR